MATTPQLNQGETLAGSEHLTGGLSHVSGGSESGVPNSGNTMSHRQASHQRAAPWVPRAATPPRRPASMRKRVQGSSEFSGIHALPPPPYACLLGEVQPGMGSVLRRQ